MSIGPKEVKKFKFTFYYFDHTNEVRSEARFVTKPMTTREFKKLIKREYEKFAPNCCYKIGEFR